MSLTITIPGAVNVTTGAMAPAVLTIGVGVPGATGPAGPAGPGVPVGGTAGQYLQKIDGTNYNTDWVTVNLGAYAVKANNLSDLTNFGTARTNLGLGTMAVATAADYSTTTVANGLYYPLSGNPSAFLTSASLSGYLTSATAASTYAVIAAGQPTSGTVGQVLTKNSGTNYDSSWQTLIPGDRYLTSSTTSLTINNANKTLTIGTGLSYTTQQDIVIAYDAANHMHARVLTYNSGTGVMDVDVLTHSGSGTYATWTVNVGGAPALASVVWGDITGTLGNQTDLATALNSKLELAGGVLTVNSTIDASTTTQASVFSGTGVTAELSANPSENSSLQYSGLQVQNAAGTMSVTPAGLTFPNASTQTVAYPGTAGFLLKADNLSGLADTAVSRTNLGLGTMATATAADYSTITVANGLYYPLSGNPSAFLVAADIAGKAPLASPALTGNVTIVSNSSGAALFIEQAGAGNILTLHDQASDTTFVTIDANGKVNTIASEATNGAGFNIAHGAAPTTPVNGDIWTTTSGLFMRQSGVTKQYVDFDTSQTINGNKTFSNATQTLGNSTAAGTIGIGTGATISGATRTINIGTASAAGSTNNINIGGGSGTTNVTLGGSIALSGPITAVVNNISLGTGTGASLYAFGTGATATGLTKAMTIGTGGLAGSTTTIAIGSATSATTTTVEGTVTLNGTALNLGTSTAASTINIGTGATLTATTKAINIGTNGVSGSTTNINLGTTSGGAGSITLSNNTTINATLNVLGPNLTLGSSTAASTINLGSGATVSGSTKTVNIGTGGLASSTTTIIVGSTNGTTTTLQGTTNGVTAAADTNSVALATTAFVVGQAGSATPLVNGTAAVGTSLRYARQDHVHGTDTSRAPLASPTFTGTPTLPTGTIATTQTTGNNTTAVATTAFVQAAIPATATHIQSLQFASTTAFTKVIDASSQLLAPSVIKIWPSPSNVNGTSTSGAGASAALSITGYILASPSAGVAGSARCFFANSASDLAAAMWGGTNPNSINFGRRVSMAFRFSQYPSSTASVTRVVLGKIHGAAVGDLATAGIGVKYVPNGANFDFQLQVHNGTTLTTVTSSTQYAGGVADLEVVSDGAGNAVLYLNGNQVASTTGAPTGVTGANATVFAEVDSTASTANQPEATIGRLTVNTLNF